MKKMLLPVLIVLLFFSSTTLAQLPFKLGVRAGLNIGNLSFDPALPSVVDKTARTGFKVGALVELGVIPIFSVQIEPMYAMKGSKFSQGGNDATFKLSYIEIPILLKLKIPSPLSIKPYVFIGPDIGFLSSATNEYTGGSEDIKALISSTDFALDFGAGVGFEVAPLVTLLIDARYSLGLTSIINDQGKQVLQLLLNANESEMKTSDIQILAGIMFGL